MLRLSKNGVLRKIAHLAGFWKAGAQAQLFIVDGAPS